MKVAVRLAVSLCLVGLLGAACAWAESLTCEQWAEKLKAYKADTSPESKGFFGVPTEDVGVLKKVKPNYDEAKTAYEEFKKTGMKPDDCWQLRDAEYSIRVALANYEAGIERLVKRAEDEVESAAQWLTSNPDKAWNFGRDRLAGLKTAVENAATISASDSPRIKPMRDRLALIDKQVGDAKAAAIEKVRMKPDVYKGKDSAKLKALAKSIVAKAHPKASLLRVSITSKTWERESVVEFTDTTNTALQHRVTDGVFAQVAAKEGADCAIYTLFLNKNKIGGKQGGLQGHVMYQDTILEKNVVK